MDNLNTFRKQYYKENYHHIRSMAYHLLNEKGFADAVTRLTFHMAFRRKFDLPPSPRIWFLSAAAENIDLCNNLTDGEEVTSDD